MHIVYETTCLINGKKYIGVHNKEKDDYLGSGLALLKAVKRYGKSKFVRETLHRFDTQEEAYLKEAELVTPEIVNSRQYYNIALGGGQPPNQSGANWRWKSGAKRNNTIAYSQANIKRWQDPQYKKMVTDKMKQNPKNKSPERIEHLRKLTELRIKGAQKYQVDDLGTFTLREFCDKMGYSISACRNNVKKKGPCKGIFKGHTFSKI